MNPECPACGNALPADAVEGLCPPCLMGRALQKSAPDEETVGDEPEMVIAAPPPFGTLRYFGDYQLLEEIARGGMGVVYKARQVSLNRVVAIKTILAGQLASEAQVARFHAEAEAAANLQHPNIVAIHEVGRCDGQHYFSMDYIEGRNLAELIRMEGPLNPGRAAAYVKMIAEAVHYGHLRGTYHRDLKPQNVLIDTADRPRVTDFGLAKQQGKQDGLTQTGAVLGTPAYMPPEQAAGRVVEVGPESDVYSLGAVLYFLLTGREPFSGGTSIDVLRQVMDVEPVAPSRIVTATPAELETICLKCLEKQTERRYRSARELAEDLGRYLSGEPILAKPASAGRKVWLWLARNPWALMAAGSAVILALVGFAYGLWERNAFLHWRFANPNQPAPFPVGFFESSVFHFASTLMLMPLMTAAWLDLAVRRGRGVPIRLENIVIYLAVGGVEIAIGVAAVLLWAHARAWEWPVIAIWYASRLTLVLAFAFTACGALTLWEGLRENAARRLNPAGANKGARWPRGFFSTFEDLAMASGFSVEPVKLGAVRVSGGAVATMIIVTQVLVSPAMMSFKLWWAPAAMTGLLIPAGCMMASHAWSTASGLRYYFLITTAFSVLILSAYVNASREGALAAFAIPAAISLVMMDLARPSSEGFTRGTAPRWARLLKYLGAWVSFTTLCLLIAPARGYARDGMAMALGALALAAGLWCASSRPLSRPRHYILVALIVALGLWIITVSPYALR